VLRAVVLTQYRRVTDRQTSRLVFTARLRAQVRMPPVRNAHRTSCPNESSERAQIPNFRTRSILNLWTRPMSSFWTYVFVARLYHTLPAANGVVRCATIGACSEHALLAAGAQHWTGVSRPYLRCGDMGRLPNVSPPSVLFESSPNFFTIHRRHRRKKMVDQNFEIRILWFLRIFFWNFQEGVARSLCGRSGPLWSPPN